MSDDAVQDEVVIAGSSPRDRKRRSARDRYWRRNDGSATIETVLWMPVYVFFLSLVFDSSFIFFNKTQVLRAVQDANRAYSVGRFKTLEETEDAIRNVVAAIGGNPEVDSTVNNGVISSMVRIRAGDLGGIGLIRTLADVPITVTGHHVVEG
jgi:Flp pilus assembly protein TadG